MTRRRRLLILGPSFRRNRSDKPLSSLERYDGIFFRVARKYLKSVKDVDVVVMVDDLTLVEGTTLLSFTEPRKGHWRSRVIPKDSVVKANLRNVDFLKRKLRSRKYSEVFISMGKKYAEALPTLTQYNIQVIFPSTGGLGPKAQALKEWFNR